MTNEVRLYTFIVVFSCRFRLCCIASGDVFVNSAQRKKEIRSLCDGACVEMEGASIAQVCLEFNSVRSYPLYFRYGGKYRRSIRRKKSRKNKFGFGCEYIRLAVIYTLWKSLRLRLFPNNTRKVLCRTFANAGRKNLLFFRGAEPQVPSCCKNWVWARPKNR